MRLDAITRCLVSMAALLVVAGGPLHAGEINLSWNPVPGATGYRVYYGTTPGQYTGSTASAAAQTRIQGLVNCTTYYAAVKAVNAAGESTQFSNEISGWARPEVQSFTIDAEQLQQGSQFTLSIDGANFATGAELLLDLCPTDAAKMHPGACGCGVADTDTDGDGFEDCRDTCPDPTADANHDGTPDCTNNCANPSIDTDGDGIPNCRDADAPPMASVDVEGAPLVRIETAQVVQACNRIQALVTIESDVRGFRSMSVGPASVGFTVRNSGGVFGTRSGVLDVELAPERLDINRSDAETRDRVDGKDLVWLAYAHASSEGESRFNPDADLNGDGVVDGEDLAYLSTGFGSCWTSSGWSADACN